MEVASFAEIAEEFHNRIARIAWATVATIVDDRAAKDRIWDLFVATPPPLGYDPILFWKEGKGDPTYGLLRLDPTRIELTGLRHRAAGPPLVRRAPGE